MIKKVGFLEVLDLLYLLPTNSSTQGPLSTAISRVHHDNKGLKSVELQPLISHIIILILHALVNDDHDLSAPYDLHK